jgi:LDH2 family malate/lactate/ureidoglycolate dehydrogenase
MNRLKLKKLVKDIFLKHGLNNDHSEISSNYIIQAELFGAPSHGLSRLKMYCNRIKKKESNTDIVLRETTQNSAHKLFFYTGKRILLSENKWKKIFNY